MSAYKLRIAFISLHFQSVPIEMLLGRFQGGNQHICIYRISIEDLQHYVLNHCFYLEARGEILVNILLSLHLVSHSDKLNFMLSDTDSYIFSRKTLYALAARKIRTHVATKKVTDTAFQSVRNHLISKLSEF